MKNNQIFSDSSLNLSDSSRIRIFILWRPDGFGFWKAGIWSSLMSTRAQSEQLLVENCDDRFVYTHPFTLFHSKCMRFVRSLWLLTYFSKRSETTDLKWISVEHDNIRSSRRSRILLHELKVLIKAWNFACIVQWRREFESDQLAAFEWSCLRTYCVADIIRNS